MIRISADCSAHPALYLTAQGHSGHAARGQDIVCAGISAIINALGFWLSKQSGRLCPGETVLDFAKGRAVVRCVPKNADREIVLQMFKFAIDGISLIAGEYPECVEIKNIKLQKGGQFRPNMHA